MSFLHLAHKLVDATGTKRHDVLQERGNTGAVAESDTESGDSESGSAESGSGETMEPQFQLPDKKTTIDSETTVAETSGDSDSGSGSGDESGDSEPEEKPGE